MKRLYSNEQIINALEKNNGNQAACAKELSVHASYISNRAKTNPDIRLAYDRIRQNQSLKGEKRGNWQVLERAKDGYAGGYKWLCRCLLCGKTKVVNGNSLKRGDSKGCKSCSLKSGQNSLKHGHNKLKQRSPTLISYQNMVRRCTNPQYHYYKLYKDKLCERWNGENGFLNFLEDMGEKPSKKHSIDRISNSGIYEKANCRWATTKEQAENRTDNVLVPGYDGIAKRFSEENQMNRNSTTKLVSMGWTAEAIALYAQMPLKEKRKIGAMSKQMKQEEFFKILNDQREANEK